MGRPEGERQLEELCSYIKVLGDEGVPVVQVFLEEVRRGPGGVPGRYEKKHRGGYRMDAFSLELMRRELAKRNLKAPWSHHFTDKIAPEEYFSRCVEICKRIVPEAEKSQVKLALHTDDPPVPDAEGLLPGLWNPLLINSLFDAVSSRNLGLLFCCGTRYESGINIFDQIRLFGRMGKIFYIHLRNVRGTIPSAGAYDEVALDDGDMGVFDVLKALKKVGYDGAVYPDHFPALIGDSEGKASIAFAVGYIRALISALHQRRSLRPFPEG